MISYWEKMSPNSNRLGGAVYEVRGRTCFRTPGPTVSLNELRSVVSRNRGYVRPPLHSFLGCRMDVINSLPLFPLERVLYPGEHASLHIFEERYKDLTSYCLEHEVPFGIVWTSEAGADEEWGDVGTMAHIEEVSTRYEDGRLDIVVRGGSRFRIEEVDENFSYFTADVTVVKDEERSVDPELRERVITQHMRLLELAGRTVRPDLYENVDVLSFVLAQNAALDSEQKQEVLEFTTERERIRYLIHHFESIIPQLEQREGMRKRIRSNGHFKDFPPEEV